MPHADYCVLWQLLYLSFDVSTDLSVASGAFGQEAQHWSQALLVVGALLGAPQRRNILISWKVQVVWDVMIKMFWFYKRFSACSKKIKKWKSYPWLSAWDWVVSMHPSRLLVGSRERFCSWSYSTIYFTVLVLVDEHACKLFVQL